jgi:hypothetical protein
MCSDTFCHSHDKGDCSIPEHQDGITCLDYIMKKSYIFHLILSLLPNIRFDVYDTLYERYENDKDTLDLLPFKQTLVIISKFKKHIKDYNEDVVYERLSIEHPMNIDEFANCKNAYISVEKYIESYSKESSGSSSLLTPTSTSSFVLESTYMSAWRSLIYSTLTNSINRANDLTSIRIDRLDNNEVSRPLLEYTNVAQNNGDTDVQNSDDTNVQNTTIFNSYSLIIDNNSDNYDEEYEYEDDEGYLTE